MEAAIGLAALLVGLILGIAATVLQRTRRSDPRPTTALAEMIRSERSIARREQNIAFVLRHYAEDRLLQFLESTPDAERALEIAHSLDVGFQTTKPVFPWLTAAYELIRGLPQASASDARPAPFTSAKFQELERRASKLANACVHAHDAEKRYFASWMGLASNETPQAATERIFAGGKKAIAELLIAEIRMAQASFLENEMRVWENTAAASADLFR